MPSKKVLFFFASSGFISGLFLRKATYILNVDLPQPEAFYRFEPGDLPSRFPDYFEFNEPNYVSFDHPEKPPTKLVDINGFWSIFRTKISILKNSQSIFEAGFIEEARALLKNRKGVFMPLFDQMITVFQTHDAPSEAPENYRKLQDGALFTILDNAKGNFVSSSLVGAPCVTGTLKINYLRDILKDSGKEYLIESRIEMKRNPGTRSFGIKSQVKDKQGRLYAEAHAVFVRLPFWFNWVGLK